MTIHSDDADAMTINLIRKGEALMVDGSGGTKFERCLIGDTPAMILTNPELNKKVIITGEVLAGMNGWLARAVRLMKEAQEKAVRH